MNDSVRPESNPDVEITAALLRGRRTINLFEAEPVDQTVLLDAIEVARWAPNHKLTEPWRFYLLGNATTAQAIDCWASYEAKTRGDKVGAARRQRLRGVPGHFLVTSLRDESEVLDLENYAATCCAIQNLMLYLWQRGVGVKWTSGQITREQSLYDVVGIDSSAERIVGYFWYGIPKVVADQSRKAVEEISVTLP